MDFEKLNALKGFMPNHEGLALTKWAEKFSSYGPALEIGTFGAKSSLYIAAGTSVNKQLVYTIDHHSGSEEHQLGEEYELLFQLLQLLIQILLQQPLLHFG